MSDLVPTGSAPEPILATLGDISVTHHWVFVPQGRFPLAGTAWTVQDLSHTEQRMSTLGIVLAVIFVWFFFLGLLFLLMRETRQVGWIQVAVQGEGLYHATMLPAGPASMAQAHSFANYCRGLSAA